MDNETIKLKNEIESKSVILDVEKENFARQLKNGLGDKIMSGLNNPVKLSWFDRLKIRFSRWKMLRREKKKAKQLLMD